jgi:hypothetical protein
VTRSVSVSEPSRELRRLLAVAMVGLFFLGTQSLVAEENCCSRNFAVPPASMPRGKYQGWGGQIASAISSAFAAKGGALRHCPLQLEEHDLESGAWLNEFIDKLSTATGGAPSGLSGQQLAGYEMDYLIVSSVSAGDRQFTATVTLLDHHHGQTVNSGSYSWSGEITGFGSGLTAWVDATFNPLDDIIYDYERKPQLCRITLEGSSQSIVQAGDTVTVRLSEIFDHQSRPSQKWQRVYVKAEKGKILNGREKGEYRVFEVGDGKIGVTYRAPDACKSDKDTITVYNTCYTKNNPDGTPLDAGPDKELAKKEFNIVCDQWDVKITYTEDLGGTYNPGGKTKVTVTRHYSVTFKARVKFVKADRRKATYRSDDSDIQFHDNYNSHTVQEVCSYRGGFTGNKSGRGPVPIQVTFNSHNQTYSFGLGDTKSDLVSYTLSGNLLGPHEQCTGIWQQEVQQQSQAVVPRGLEKGEGPPQNRTWTPGQESITGQASWEDYMIGAWPTPGTPPTHSLLMPPSYRLVYLPLVYDWGKFPNMRFKKTLSWEIKRPK